MRCLWEKVKNIIDPDRPQMTLWRMRIARWVPKANKYTLRIRNTDFLQQQWLHERASRLRYVYISCLVTKWMWKYYSDSQLETKLSLHQYVTILYTLYVAVLTFPLCSKLKRIHVL